MSRPARILLTGGTGTFGRALALALLRAGLDLVLLVRAEHDADAWQRVSRALDLRSRPRSLTVVTGDLAREGLGLTERWQRELAVSVTSFVHAAATTRFNQPLESARRANVETTRNVLAFAEQLRHLSLFGYVSTAFVAGKRVGRIRESELEHAAGFVTSYERSKYEAERLVAHSAGTLPVVVFRPSVIVGDAGAEDASALGFVGKLISRGLLPALPGRAEDPVDVIAASDAAAAITELLLASRPGAVYHIASGDRAPCAGDVAEALLPPGARRPVQFVDAEHFGSWIAELGRLNPHAARAYRDLSAFIYLLAYSKVFDTREAEAALRRPVRTSDPVAALRSIDSRRLDRKAA